MGSFPSSRHDAVWFMPTLNGGSVDSGIGDIGGGAGGAPQT